MTRRKFESCRGFGGTQYQSRLEFRVVMGASNAHKAISGRADDLPAEVGKRGFAFLTLLSL